MAKYLVTGGAGFIGSNIVKQLLKEGHFVRVLDNFYSGKEDNLKEVQGLARNQFDLIRGDVRDEKICQAACEKIDYILHHAALCSVPESMEKPALFNDVNINGTCCILKAAVDCKVKRFVLASSSAVYGDSSKFPQKEKQPVLPISPYGLSKLSGEYYCRIFSLQYGLSTVCLRYFNVFGPGQSGEDQYSAVIPKFINAMLKDEPPTIFGDGKQSRDFTYIDNVVLANILAATTPGIKHEVLNAATGQSTTILRMVDSLNRLLGKNIKPIFLPSRAGDIFKSSSDISKAQKVLTYKPTVTFDAGLQKLCNIFNQRINQNIFYK